MSVPTQATHSRFEGEAGLSAWIDALRQHGERHGFFDALDDRHGAIFTEEEEDVLLVSFESAAQMRQTATGLPWALRVAGREGWSQLCLFSVGETFFRSHAVHEFFDSLIDTGFFDRFGKVVFYGAGPEGYAAAAYSVAAPGATVLLLRPLATLDPRRAGWDTRFPALRRTDFNDRFGYAPDMLEAAGRAFILYDPLVAEDAMHAALFGLPDERHLRCRWIGPAPEKDLDQMGILAPMLRAAGKGTLDAPMFHAFYRRRQQYRPYLNRILNRLRAEKRAGLCRHWSAGIRRRIAAAEKARATA